MYVLLLISLLVLGLVAHAHGFLIGLAAGVGTFAGLVALVLLLGQWAKKQQPPAPYTSPEPEPAQDAADLPPGWEAIAPRDSDRTLPRDRLPFPLGGGVTADDRGVPPGYLGRECYFLPLRIDLGPTPYCWSWRAATWFEGKAAHEVFATQFYDRLRGALADPDGPDGQATPLIDEDDLARHRAALEGTPRFFAFRSRDARWGGFLLGDASFRFPLERLAGLHLRIGRPARGSGGYELCVVLADGEERTRFLETHLAYEPLTTSSLLVATMRLGRLFDVHVGAEEYMDESRGVDASRPYDR